MASTAGLLYSGGQTYTISGTSGSGFIGSGTTNEFIVNTTGSGNLTVNAASVRFRYDWSSHESREAPGMLTLGGTNNYTGRHVGNGRDG